MTNFMIRLPLWLGITQTTVNWISDFSTLTKTKQINKDQSENQTSGLSADGQ